MDNIFKIERILRKGLFSLSDSLHYDWPLPIDDEDNEISEANLNIHIAHSFINSGFVVFSEYRINKNEHHDLLIIDPETDFKIVVESKRYLKTDKNYCLSKDINRAVDFWRSKKEKVAMIVVAMTWHEDILKWWMTEDKSSPPKKRATSKEWHELKQQFKELKIYPGHMHLPNYNEDEFFHDVFYGIFDI